MSLKISMDEELIKNLEDSGKFQVLRKIETPDFYDQYDGSKIFQGLPKTFIFPSLRLIYLRLAYLYYGLIDKWILYR